MKNLFILIISLTSMFQTNAGEIVSSEVGCNVSIPCLAERELIDGFPVMLSGKGSVTIISMETKESLNWNLAPDLKPDIYTASLLDGKTSTYIFRSDIDSMSFKVELGKAYDFIIIWGDKLCYQQLKGVKYIPAAVFNEEYQKARGGKIFISIPEVYELVNIGIAISDNGIEEKYKVYKKSDYYNEVQKHFEPYRNHPFIQKLDSIFDNNENYYASLKMNGNSFVFDEQGQIVQSPIFNRTGFRGQKTNMLSPFVKEMQSFSDESNFRSFYKKMERFTVNRLIFTKTQFK